MDLTSFPRASTTLRRRLQQQSPNNNNNDINNTNHLLTLLDSITAAAATTTTTPTTKFNSLIQLSTTPTDWACRATGILGLSTTTEIDFSHHTHFLPTCLQLTREQFLNDNEVRVREITNTLVDKLSKINPEQTWDELIPVLLSNIQHNFTLTEEERGIEAEKQGIQQTNRQDYPVLNNADDYAINGVLLPLELIIKKTNKYSCISFMPSTDRYTTKIRADSSIASARSMSQSGEVILMVHETMGWKSLETSLQCLKTLLRNSLHVFNSNITQFNTIINMVCNQAATHENRYVREVAFDILSIIGPVIIIVLNSTTNATSRECNLVEQRIVRGMDDGWPQVRLKACGAVRSFAIALKQQLLPTTAVIHSNYYWNDLIPRLCFNRYHVAEGIRNFSLETWKLIVENQGPAIVASHIQFVVEYYSQQCRSKDDTLRETACLCIIELATKINPPDCVIPYANMLVEYVKPLLKDSSWLVRSAAGLAVSRLCCSFFSVISTQTRMEIYELLFNNVSGSIWSVRQESAVAVGFLLKKFPEEVTPLVEQKMNEWFGEAFKEDEHGHSHHQGNHKKSSAATDPSHENQIMFSCCTPMPSSANVKFRKSEPWEYTDGAIYLLVELIKSLDNSSSRSMTTTTSARDQYMLKYFLPICKKADLYQHYNVLETTWKQLPILCEALGKRIVKLKYLDEFLPYLATSLKKRDEAPLAAYSSSEALKFLSEWIGQGVFKGRCENLGINEMIERNPPESFDVRPNIGSSNNNNKNVKFNV
jgi:hypothetical protein